MFDFEKEYKKAYDIYKKANNWIQDFYKVIDTDESFSISQSFHDEFNKFAFKFDKQVNKINEEIKKQKISNQDINDEEINKLKSLSINFDSLKKDFNEISEILWHYLIEKDHERLVENNEKLLGLINEVESLKNSNNHQIDIVKDVKEKYENDFTRVSELEEKIKVQVEEVKKLEDKYEGITKEFLTAMALFVALFSVVTVNTKLFEGNLNIFMVVITNLTILIAISVIFAFVFQIFNYKPRKEQNRITGMNNENLDSNNKEKKSVVKSFFTQGFFRIIISGLILALLITLIIYGICTSRNKDDVDDKNTNSSSSSSSQAESSTTAASNFSTGINVLITY